ncbi:MAG: LptE family protein [Candidatus Omnitrophica bacterium]|nr:LptE family protein [Candidatus Omnitrophota bacterium]
MIKFGLLFILGCVFFITGCGYTTGSVISSQYQTVYVAPFENKTDYVNAEARKLYIPGLETRVRSTIIDRYLFDGNLRIGEETVADLVLQGKLLSYDREDLALTNNQDVSEYRIRITVELTMTDPIDKRILWQEPSFSGEATYLTTGGSESAALDAALKDLAMRVVARTVEDW